MLLSQVYSMEPGLEKGLYYEGSNVVSLCHDYLQEEAKKSQCMISSLPQSQQSSYLVAAQDMAWPVALQHVLQSSTERAEEWPVQLCR